MTNIGTISPRTVIVTPDGRLTTDGFAYLQSLRTEVTGGTEGDSLEDLYAQQFLLPPTGAVLNETEQAQLMATISMLAGAVEALRRRIEDLEHEVLL